MKRCIALLVCFLLLCLCACGPAAETSQTAADSAVSWKEYQSPAFSIAYPDSWILVDDDELVLSRDGVALFQASESGQLMPEQQSATLEEIGAYYQNAWDADTTYFLTGALTYGRAGYHGVIHCPYTDGESLFRRSILVNKLNQTTMSFDYITVNDEALFASHLEEVDNILQTLQVQGKFSQLPIYEDGMLRYETAQEDMPIPYGESIATVEAGISAGGQELTGLWADSVHQDALELGEDGSFTHYRRVFDDTERYTGTWTYRDGLLTLDYQMSIQGDVEEEAARKVEYQVIYFKDGILRLQKLDTMGINQFMPAAWLAENNGE